MEVDVPRTHHGASQRSQQRQCHFGSRWRQFIYASLYACSPDLRHHPPRDPDVFTGVGSPDVGDWLRLYGHASTIHRWDPTIILANDLSYLDDTPGSWFQTHEDGNYMVAPFPAVMLAHGVTVRHTVLTFTGNRTCLPLVNLALSAQVLPQGFSLAVISALQDHQVEPFKVEDCCISSPYRDVIPRQWRRH